MTQQQVFGWTIGLACGCLAACAAVVFWVDPYFHYRAPDTKRFCYTLDNQRCQNYGIVRHFDYQALVTGSSMCENFRSSDVERLWGFKTVKVTFSGASFKEMRDLILRAKRSNPRLEMVIVGLDWNKIFMPKDWMRNDLGQFPEYLYDDCVLNDIKYLLNYDALKKSVMAVAHYGRGGITSFDDFSYWHDENTKYGAAAGLVNTPEEIGVQQEFSPEIERTVRENFEANVVPIIKSVKKAYFFVTPYSAQRMRLWKRAGRYNVLMNCAALIVREIARYPNARAFRFDDRADIVENIDNYKDYDHYGPWINKLILEEMRASESTKQP